MFPFAARSGISQRKLPPSWQPAIAASRQLADATATQGSGLAASTTARANGRSRRPPRGETTSRTCVEVSSRPAGDFARNVGQRRRQRFAQMRFQRAGGVAQLLHDLAVDARRISSSQLISKRVELLAGGGPAVAVLAPKSAWFAS